MCARYTARAHVHARASHALPRARAVCAGAGLQRDSAPHPLANMRTRRASAEMRRSLSAYADDEYLYVSDYRRAMGMGVSPEDESELLPAAFWSQRVRTSALADNRGWLWAGAYPYS